MEKKKAYGNNMGIGEFSAKNSRNFMSLRMNDEKPKLLLHSCCGPCSTAVIERLAPDYDLTVFYFNPCITDEEEYRVRKANQIAFIEAFNKDNAYDDEVKFLEGDYEPELYLELVKGLENAPEGGERCTLCFMQRLRETAKTACEQGINIFTTTLSVSPHKDYARISKIGKDLAKEYDIEFLDMDFKKKAGFQRSVQLAKEYGLYRQDYCGCEFSKRDQDIHNQEIHDIEGEK